ncbi:MAG: hypothetical protein H0Z28_00520 [Archaeoglobus sp.]|nr:hypothetical protein [Archaeoglobus sp.]
MLAYRSRVSRPKTAPKLIVSTSILLIYYNILGLIVYAMSPKMLIVGGVFLLSSSCLLLLNSIGRIKIRKKLFHYIFYFLLISFYIIGSFTLVYYLFNEAGFWLGLVVAELLVLLGIFLSPIGYVRTVFNLVGSVIGLTLVFAIVSLYPEHALLIVFSFTAITFLPSAIFRRKVVIAEILAVVFGVASLQILSFSYPHYSWLLVALGPIDTPYLPSLILSAIYLGLSIGLWIYSTNLEFPIYAPKVLFVLSALEGEEILVSNVCRLGLLEHSLITFVAIFLAYLSVKNWVHSHKNGSRG